LKRRIKHFHDRPLYNWLYKRRPLFSRRYGLFCHDGLIKDGVQRNKRVVEVLERSRKTVRFPGQPLFTNADGENHRFLRKFRRVRKSEVLQRAPTLAVAIVKAVFKKTFGRLA